MSLGFYRLRLIDCILSQVELPRIMRAMDNWWVAYKRWEADDRFLTAIRENRMVIRQSPLEKIVPDGVVNGLGMRHLGERPNVLDTQYAGYRSNAGLSGIKARMTPGSFDHVEASKGIRHGEHLDTRGKYVLGLHDLSASLLDPQKPVLSNQCRWKDDGKATGKFNEWILVFMPIADAEDVKVLNMLSYMSKVYIANEWHDQDPHRTFCNTVRHMSKRMTRIKFGQSSDMGAGFVNKELRADALPKFRYGAGDVQGEWKPAIPGSKTLVLKQHYAEGVSKTRAQAALDYSKLLEVQRTNGSTSNEVILCVREHEGTRFPLYAEWDGTIGGFECLPGEASSAFIHGRVVPDQWEQTREL